MLNPSNIQYLRNKILTRFGFKKKKKIAQSHVIHNNQVNSTFVIILQVINVDQVDLFLTNKKSMWHNQLKFNNA